MPEGGVDGMNALPPQRWLPRCRGLRREAHERGWRTVGRRWSLDAWITLRLDVVRLLFPYSGLIFRTRIRFVDVDGGSVIISTNSIGSADIRT